MRIGLRFSPKGVTLWFAAFLHQLAKAGCLHLHQLHETKKSARELRQGGSDYRCCIPALAGFVSPQSIVPDGDRLFAKDRLRAIVFSGSPSTVARRLAAAGRAYAKGMFDLIRYLSVLSTW